MYRTGGQFDRSSSLLTALAVIAAGVLGGCSDKVVGTVDWNASSPVVPADHGSRQMLAQSAPAPPASSPDVKRRLVPLMLIDMRREVLSPVFQFLASNPEPVECRRSAGVRRVDRHAGDDGAGALALP